MTISRREYRIFANSVPGALSGLFERASREAKMPYILIYVSEDG